MRIIHAALVARNCAYNSYTVLSISAVERAKDTKTITFFCDWRYNLPQSQFSISEEYC